MKWRRLSLYLLVTFTFIAKARSQLVTFSVKNESLEKVFLRIEQQSNFHFIYTTEVLAGSKSLTLSVTAEPLGAVLDKCFAGQRLTYKFSDQNIIVQEREKPVGRRPLAGKVVDSDGGPMSGVTVTVKKPFLQTGTGDGGEFSFPDVPVGAVGEITGAEIEAREFETGSLSFINVVVTKRLATLDETIVIGYGKTTRRSATETVVSVKGSEIMRHPVSNALGVLGGLVSGLQVTQQSGVPGSGFTVRIRGRNSIASGNEPLYIVDGVPFPGATMNGLYGGAAGTTSSPLDNLNPADIASMEILKDAAATAIYGSRGANGVILITTRNGRPGKTTFALRTYAGAGIIEKRYDMMQTPEYLAMRREAFAMDNMVPALNNAPDLLLWDTTRYTNWQNFIFGGTSRITEVNPSISGGSEFTQFNASMGYRRETTVFPGDFYLEKFSGSFSVNHASQDRKFQLGMTGSFLLNTNLLPQQDLLASITLPPNAPSIYSPEGKLNWEQSTWINPQSETMKTFRNATDNYIFSANASYRLPLGFSLRMSTGYNDIHLREHSVNPAASQNPLQPVTAVASFGQRSIRSLIFEPQLAWKQNFGASEIDVLTGASLQQSIQQSLYQSGSGYSSDELLQSLKSAPTITTAGEEYIKYRYAALFARFNYAWGGKYIASVALRRDGSSRYGPADRFSNFGSAALAWILTKEKFLRWQPLDFAKLKISAGITGNDQIGDYRYLDLYSAFTYPYQNVSTFYPTQLFNATYGWEKVTKLEAAWESIWWKGRLSLNVNYYHNTTSSQLVNYALPSMTGFTGIVKNIPATIRNTGLEVEIAGDVIRRRKFSWNIALNITVPKNKLLSFENLAGSSYASLYEIGQPLSISKVLHYTGVDPAAGVYTFRDVNADGKLTIADDYTSVIDLSQTFFGGMQHRVISGRWSASLLLQFAAQPNALDDISRYNRPGTISNQPVMVRDHWTKPGEEARFQRYAVTSAAATTAFNNYKLSDAMYSNASYVRLKNLYLAYDFAGSAKWLKAVRECKLIVMGQNLFTITKLKNLDPETINALPPVTMVTAGVQLTF